MSRVILIMAVLTLGGGCALQEDLVAVNNRVISLEQRASRQGEKAEADRAALRSEIERYHEAYRSRHAELHALMKDLREEIQELRGELEESQYEARQGIGALSESESRQKGRWENLEKSLQSSLDHIVRLEQYLGMEPSERLASLEAGEDEPEKGKPKAKKTPDERYAMAKQRFDRGEYEAARQLFEGFLKQYPKSKRADNARFWIGEIYYREKWYEKAILEYQKVIENYPKGDKVRGALLKQGFAFLNLGDKANARLILMELVRKYPASNEANIAKKKLKTLQ